MKDMAAFWAILRKDVENYYLKPPNISWGIIFPFSWALMQMIRSSGNVDISHVRDLLPGLMAMSVLFGTTSMLAVTITFERRGRSFDRLLLAPISLNTLVLAKIAGAILFGSLNAFIPLLFAGFFTQLGAINWGALIFVVLLIATTSALLGLAIAISAKEVFEAQTMSNFFRFPMLFLCGLFVPLERVPVFLKPVSRLLPLTYGTDMLNWLLLDQHVISTSLSTGVMIVSAAALFYFCRSSINRKWIT